MAQSTRITRNKVNAAAYIGAGIIQPGGGTPPVGPTLKALTLTGNSFTAGAAPGTVIGTISGKTAGSTITVTPNDGRLALSSDGTQLLVGLSASSAGTIAVTLTETLAGATNSPRATSGLTVTVNAASESMPASVASVGYVGDSFTLGTGANPSTSAFLPMLGTSLSASTVLNKGIGGTLLQNSNDTTGSPRANNMRDRFAADLLGANKQEFGGIGGGFNDARYTLAPATINVENYAVKLREIVDLALGGNYALNRFGISTPYWISDVGLMTGTGGFAGSTRENFENYVAVAKMVAAEKGVFLADTYAAMRDGGGESLISTDLIHSNNAGHLVIRDAILASKRYPAIGVVQTVPLKMARPILVASSGALTVRRELPPFSGNSAITGYDLRYSADGGSTWTVVSGISASQAVSGLTNGTVYQVQTRAKNAVGPGPWSESATRRVVDTSTSFVIDSFTDADNTLLENHVGEKGASWSKHPAYANNAIRIANNRAYCSAVAALYAASGEAPSPDVEASINLFGVTAATTDIGVTLRLDATRANFYGVRYVQSSNIVQILASIYGTLFALASFTPSPAFAAGDAKKLTGKVVGTTIKALIDGVEVASAEDGRIRDGALVGIRGGAQSGATSGFHAADFEAKIAA